MAEEKSGGGGMSIGGGGGGGYSGYFQAGSATLGIVMDAIKSKRNREYNERLMELDLKQAAQQREDMLRQAAIQNRQQDTQLGMQQRQMDFGIKQGEEAMGMKRIDRLRDSLQSLIIANPSLRTGMNTLFGGGR